VWEAQLLVGPARASRRKPAKHDTDGEQLQKASKERTLRRKQKGPTGRMASASSRPVERGASSNSPEPRVRVGLRDVAEVAGVSTATVSRFINNPELVSSELRARIASVVRHLKWVPDGRARALATRRTGTIGAVFPTLSHGDFARAIEALQNELGGLGYTLLLACSEYQPEQEYQQVRKLVERGVDGIILVGEAHDPSLTEFLAHCAVPYVNTFVYNPQSHGTCIGPDNHKALYRLTNYLADLGHRRFGVIAQSTDNNDRAQARLQGIRDALAERSIAVHPTHFVVGLWGVAEAREHFRRVFARKPWPTALICGNAYLAVGAMLESQVQHIRVPEELSIVGYDDIEIMRELPIPITTVRVLSDEVGRRAARVLVARLENRADETEFECAAEIIVRVSSGPPGGKRKS
jgi:LacI family transcriptional regulator